MRDKEYVRIRNLSVVAVLCNVVAGVIQALRGHWLWCMVAVVCGVMVIVTFLRYRKAHRECEYWRQKLCEVRDDLSDRER